jgi:predicted dehydrogenase
VSPAVAVVGCGAWGRNHVRVLHGLGALAGVVEVLPALRERIQEDYPAVPVWSSLDQALARADGIVVATPAPSHAGLASRALAAGKGVLVEKPMTLCAREAQDLTALAREAGRPLMVGHLLLYQPAVQELKRLLDTGAVGRLLRIHQERLNHGRVRNTENVLWSLAPHDLAVLCRLMGGAPQGVRAVGAAFLQPGIHDDVHLDLVFSGGRSAHIHAAWYWPGKRRGLRILGSEGMIAYNEADQSLTLHRKRLRGGDPPAGLAPVDEGAERVFEGTGDPLHLEDQHFLDCLATGATPLSDGASGVQVVRILEEADAQLKESLQPDMNEGGPRVRFAHAPSPLVLPHGPSSTAKETA